MSSEGRRHLPEPWLLLPVVAAYVLLAVALRDPFLAPACALVILASYAHGRSLPRVPRHAFAVVGIAAVGGFYLTVLGGGKGLSAVNRMVPYSEHVVAFSALLLAVGLVWLWHIRIPPHIKSGLVLADAAVIAVMSGNYYGPGLGYTLAMALYFVAVIVASTMVGVGANTPARERVLRAGVCVGLLAVVGAGTWVTARGLRVAERVVLALPLGGLSLRLPVFTGLGRGNGIAIQTKVKVRQSNQLVATIDGPAPGYLRTQVMASYTSGRWRSGEDEATPLVATTDPLGSGSWYRLVESSRRPTATQVVTMAVDLGGAVPLSYGAVGLGSSDPVGFRVEPHAGVVRAEPSWSLESYTVEVGGEDGSQFAAAPRPIEAPESVLASLRPLARRITAGATSPLAAATRVEAYFHGNFEYSLDVDLRPDGDPIVDFVLNRRPAYCEHFASGMALLLLSIDIPARVVGGFSVEEQSVVSDEWLVRQRDAHAWTEVYDTGSTGWVRFDATPPGVTALRGSGDPTDWLRQAAEYAIGRPRALVRWWTAHAVGRGLGERLAAMTLAVRLHARVWLVALAVVALLVRRRALRRWVAIWRGRRGLVVDPAVDARAQASAAFRRVALALEQHGRPIAQSETLADYCARVGPAVDLEEFAALYHELRFDPTASASDRLPQLMLLAGRAMSSRGAVPCGSRPRGL